MLAGTLQHSHCNILYEVNLFAALVDCWFQFGNGLRCGVGIYIHKSWNLWKFPNHIRQQNGITILEGAYF